MNVLLPQVEGLSIEVLIFYNNFEKSIGYYRQKLMDEAQGKYISFLDDDDMIPKDFVRTIFPLLDGVDYIGFNVELRNEGERLRPVFHSLKYTEWSEDENGYYRGVTHLNPIKTSLARHSSFPELENAEDYNWTVGVHKFMAESGKAYTEHYIDRVMYLYDHFGHEPMKEREVKRILKPRYDSKNVRFHPESTKNGSVYK